MIRIPQAEMLAALKESLRNLENMALLSPDDLPILTVKRNLKAKIAEMEEQQSHADQPESDDYQIAA